MNKQDRKQLIINTFDTVASGYDRPALRFFADSGRLLAEALKLKGDEHVLDVATGTGCAALAICKCLPEGAVTGVDFSEKMLAQARAKAEVQDIRNITFTQMDMQVLGVPDNSYDAAVCSSGIFFVENMEEALKGIALKVKARGKVATTGFYDTSFQPLADLFFSRLKAYGIEPPPLSWKRIGTVEKATALFQSSGLKDIRVIHKKIGYFLKDTDEYWDWIWYSGFRGLVNQLSPQKLERFKEEHLGEVNAIASKDGIWLNVEVLITIGAKW